MNYPYCGNCADTKKNEIMHFKLYSSYIYYILYIINICYIIIKLYIIYIIKYFIVVLLQLSQFFPLCSPPSSPPPTPTVNPHPVVHVHGSFTQVPWLDPSVSFSPYPPFPSPLVTVSLFLVSMQKAAEQYWENTIPWTSIQYMYLHATSLLSSSNVLA